MRFNLILILTCFFCGTIIFPVHAYYPSTLWSSKKIGETLIGVKTGAITGPRKKEIITLSSGGFAVYTVADNQLVESFRYRPKAGGQFLKLSLLDLDDDGQDEIVLSRFYHGRAESVVGKVEANGFRNLAEISGFLHVILWKGQKRIFLQKSFGEDDYSGPLYEMALKGGKPETRGEIRTPGNLSGESMPVYSITGIEIPGERPSFLHLSSSGKIVLFGESSGKYVRKWTSGEEYGGPVFFYDREVRNILNQVLSRRFFVPVEIRTSEEEAGPGLDRGQAEPQPLLGPVGAWLKLPPEPVHSLVPEKKEGSPTIFVVKNTGYLRNVVGAVPSIKNTQIVRLAWSGYGFQEEWNSPRLDGAITDFTLVDWDGDGKEEVLAVFLLRDHGYWDTLKKQDSLLIVLKPQ